jgi:hypothetical protein
VVQFVCSRNNINIKHTNELVINLELQTVQLGEHLGILGKELGWLRSARKGQQRVDQNSDRETPAVRGIRSPKPS